MGQIKNIKLHIVTDIKTMTTPARIFKPQPPIKGSFPLDHDGECKAFMTKYMNCLADNKSSTSVCKPLSKEYLDCRMKLGLMEKEDFKKLGFDVEEEEEMEHKVEVLEEKRKTYLHTIVREEQSQ